MKKTFHSSSLEKFPVICSLCGKQTTVPFKPEPGRAVYCKDCIAKIKSGEVKVEKKGQDQIKYDETKFYKPLADLGIEFTQKDRGKVEEERYTERIDPHINKPNTGTVKSGILNTIKKVFVPEPKPKLKNNPELKEVLNKVTVRRSKPQFRRNLRFRLIL